MFNDKYTDNRFLAGVVAALAVSVLVVFASLGHAVSIGSAIA